METSDKLKLRRIPQNNWTEFFKKVKVMKDKEKKKKGEELCLVEGD